MGRERMWEGRRRQERKERLMARVHNPSQGFIQNFFLEGGSARNFFA